MFDAAFAGLAAGFSARYGGPFQSVEVIWPGVPVKDDGGSIVTPTAPVKKPARAQFDVASEAMRADAGFRQGDVLMLVLAATLDGDLDTSAKVKVVTGRYAGAWSIEAVQGDPAGIGYECRARKIA